MEGEAMSEKLSAAVEELLTQLQQQLDEVAETKNMINSLKKRMGEGPLFQDVVAESIQGKMSLRPDQYYGKPLSAAAQDYLERRNQACSAAEILKAMEDGGFD